MRGQWENGNRKSRGQQLTDLENEGKGDREREQNTWFLYSEPSLILFQRLLVHRAKERVIRKRAIRKWLVIAELRVREMFAREMGKGNR